MIKVQDNVFRSLGRYDFEDGSHLQISSYGDLDTEIALEMAETLLNLKRSEIAKMKATKAEEVAASLAESTSHETAGGK